MRRNHIGSVTNHGQPWRTGPPELNRTLSLQFRSHGRWAKFRRYFVPMARIFPAFGSKPNGAAQCSLQPPRVSFPVCHRAIIQAPMVFKAKPQRAYQRMLPWNQGTRSETGLATVSQRPFPSRPDHESFEESFRSVQWLQSRNPAIPERVA